MRLCACRFVNPCVSLVLALALVGAGKLGAEPQGRTDSVGAEKVRIEIDRRGIRVETRSGKKKVFTGTSQRDLDSVIYGWNRYREKGTDIVRFGQDVSVEKGELVRGDLVVFGGDAIVEGKVAGDVVVMGGDLKAGANAEINGDAVVLGGSIDEDPEAIIRGERVVLNSFVPVFKFGNFFGVGMGWVRFLLVLVKFFVFLLLAYLVQLLIGPRLAAMKRSLSHDYLRTLGIGALAGLGAIVVLPIATFLLSLILMVTIVGIPLAVGVLLAVAAGTAVLGMVAATVFVYDIGERVGVRMHLESSSPYLAMFIGSVILFLPLVVGAALSMLPFMFPLGITLRLLGKVFVLFAMAVGLGALVQTRLGSREPAPSPPSTSPAEATPEG